MAQTDESKKNTLTNFELSFYYSYINSKIDSLPKHAKQEIMTLFLNDYKSSLNVTNNGTNVDLAKLPADIVKDIYNYVFEKFNKK